MFYSGFQEAVLDCWWLSGNVDCFIAPGYKFNKTVSNRLSLEIPVVSGSQIGSYACQLASYGPDSITTCDLKPSLGKSIIEIVFSMISGELILKYISYNVIIYTC